MYKRQIQKLGATEGAVQDFGLHLAAVVVNDVVRAQQYLDATALAAVCTALQAFKRKVRFEPTEFDLDAMVIDDHSGQKNALPDEVGDKAVGWPVIEVVGLSLIHI